MAALFFAPFFAADTAGIKSLFHSESVFERYRTRLILFRDAESAEKENTIPATSKSMHKTQRSSK